MLVFSAEYERGGGHVRGDTAARSQVLRSPSRSRGKDNKMTRPRDRPTPNGPAPPRWPPAGSSRLIYIFLLFLCPLRNNLTLYIYRRELSRTRRSSSPRARGRAAKRERSLRKWGVGGGGAGGGGGCPSPGLRGPRGRREGGAREGGRPQPSCQRAAPRRSGGRASERAGGAVRGAAPGPRPAGDSRERGLRAHCAGALHRRTDSGERSRPVREPRVSQPRGPGSTGWGAGPGGSRRALRGGDSGRNSTTGAAGRPAREPRTGGPDGNRARSAAGFWGLGPVESRPRGSPCGPNTRQVKLNLPAWPPRLLRHLPLSALSPRVPLPNASEARSAWVRPLPPRPAGRPSPLPGGDSFLKVFLKGLTVAVSALGQTVASQSETCSLTGSSLVSRKPRGISRGTPAPAPPAPVLSRPSGPVPLRRRLPRLPARPAPRSPPPPPRLHAPRSALPAPPTRPPPRRVPAPRPAVPRSPSAQVPPARPAVIAGWAVTHPGARPAGS